MNQPGDFGDACGLVWTYTLCVERSGRPSSSGWQIGPSQPDLQLRSRPMPVSFQTLNVMHSRLAYILQASIMAALSVFSISSPSKISGHLAAVRTRLIHGRNWNTNPRQHFIRQHDRPETQTLSVLTKFVSRCKSSFALVNEAYDLLFRLMFARIDDRSCRPFSGSDRVLDSRTVRQ